MTQQKGWLTASELTTCLGNITIHGVYKALKACNITMQSISARHKVIAPENVRTLLCSRGFKYPNDNISFQVVKGGVGKTSLSFSLGVRAHHYGAKVLMIDADQQSNLTASLNVNGRDRPVWINIIRDNTPIEETVVHVSNYLHLIPSNLNNSRLDIELTQSASNLKDMIKDIISPIRDNYDLVIVDCPPAINKINTAVTCASDTIIIPVNPDPYAMDGLNFTLNELKRIKKEFKLFFNEKIIWNRYDARERLGPIYLHELAKDNHLFNKILPVVIRVDASMKNAIFDTESIFEKSKKTAIREDVDQFCKEILGVNQWAETQMASSKNQRSLHPSTNKQVQPQPVV